MKLFSEALIGKDFISRVTFYIKNKIDIALIESGWKSQIMELPVMAINPAFLSPLMFPWWLVPGMLLDS